MLFNQRYRLSNQSSKISDWKLQSCRTVKLLSCRTVEFPSCRTVEFPSCRTVELLSWRTVELCSFFLALCCGKVSQAINFVFIGNLDPDPKKFYDLKINWPEPHETKEKLIKKKHCMLCSLLVNINQQQKDQKILYFFKGPGFYAIYHQLPHRKRTTLRIHK